MVLVLPIIANLSGLKELAERIHTRMAALRLNETKLAERCSVAAIHVFDDNPPPLTRDRISKILMNRNEKPARSSAKVVTQQEVNVLANALEVPPEWLVGQRENGDPVVWNVLAQPNRVQAFVHLLHSSENQVKCSVVWGQYPAYPLVSEEFARAFNRVHFGKLPVADNRALVEFYNGVARGTRKWILRPERKFDYTNIIFQTDLVEVLCGKGIYSAISKSVLIRNIQVMIDLLTNDDLKIRLMIVKEKSAELTNLRPYQVVATVDNVLTFWNYHNGDLGWSENHAYVEPNQALLRRLSISAEADKIDPVGFLTSLKERLGTC